MQAIGIDIGGTRIKAVLLNNKGEIISQKVIPTMTPKSDRKVDPTWQLAVKEVSELLIQEATEPTLIGIASPGLPNKENTCIQILPERLPGIENFDWATFLGKPTITVINDAHSALIAEAELGSGRGYSNLVMLTIGTGVGGGILINGELYQGNHQLAGHLGHCCIDVNSDRPGITGLTGTLENAIGNASLPDRSLNYYNSTHQLVIEYMKGNSFASYLWLSSVRNLALSINSIANILSPEAFIIGGGIANAQEALYKPLNEFLDVYNWKGLPNRTRILNAHYQDFSGAIGAAAFAFRKARIRIEKNTKKYGRH